MIATDLKNRYDIVYAVEASDSNINGSPDHENRPRIDPYTNQGLGTDGFLKRKVRNFLSLAGYDIFFREEAVLNEIIEESGKNIKNSEKNRAALIREELCRKYIDIRGFGAVLNTGEKDNDSGASKNSAGNVRGPFQVTFSRSVDPVEIHECAITRVCVTTKKEADARREKNNGQIIGTMGRKFLIHYGLYKSYMSVSPAMARNTGFSKKDLSMFLKALMLMWDHDRSSARGVITPRIFYVFEHEAPKGADFALGVAPSISCIERVKISKKADVEYPRSISDYSIVFNTENMPEGLKAFNMLNGEGTHLL